MEIGSTTTRAQAAVKRFREGEQVEVQQREKGLRGAWHPGVVIGVKAGRRLVEFDELLTDDSGDKLKEYVSVGKGSDGGRLATARQPWRRFAGKILRPRPPPLREPDSVKWVKGLSVDCHVKDAWWEGVLTENASMPPKDKRFGVWFPEEEDFQQLSFTDMRVTQEWDERSDAWKVKGLVDCPPPSRFQAKSLPRKSSRLLQRSQRRSPSAEEDADESLGEEMDLGGVFRRADSEMEDSGSLLSVQLNSPARSAVPPGLLKSANGSKGPEDRASGDDAAEQRPMALRSRTLEPIAALAVNSLPARRGEKSLGTGTASDDETDHAGGASVEKSEEKSDRAGLGVRALRSRTPKSFPLETVSSFPRGSVEEPLCTTSGNDKDPAGDICEKTSVEAPVQVGVAAEAEAVKSVSAEREGLIGQRAEDSPEEGECKFAGPSECKDAEPGETNEADPADRNGGHPNEGKEADLSESKEADLSESKEGNLNGGQDADEGNASRALPEEIAEESLWNQAVEDVLQSIFDESLEGAVEQALEAVSEPWTAKSPLNDDDEKRMQLECSGWKVLRRAEKGGGFQWYYWSPNGCKLANLESAMGMCRQLRCGTANGDATPNDVKSPMFGRPLAFTRGRTGRFQSNRIAHSNLISNPSARSNGFTQLVSTVLGRDQNDGDENALSSPQKVTSKRNGLNGELIVYDVEGNEAKRRKAQGPAKEHCDCRGFLCNGTLQAGTLGLGASASPNQNCVSFVERQVPADEAGHIFTGLALETRSKRRACQMDGNKSEQTNELPRSPIRDALVDNEPKTKRSRFLSVEADDPSFVYTPKKGFLSSQDGLGKKGAALKVGSGKVAKKNRVKKSASRVKKSKKSRSGSRGVRLEVLLSAPGKGRELSLEHGEYTRKRTLLSWLIDHGELHENDSVEYRNKKDNHVMLVGSVKREGILCDHCNEIVTLSVFEAHAGSKLHRPSANIFVADGRTISACQVDALDKAQRTSDAERDCEEKSMDGSDDTCGRCGDGGQLVCCDGCPSTFHASCLHLELVPQGDWYCPNCRCSGCGEHLFSGDRTIFNDATSLTCDQCENEYHVKCLRARGLELSSLPQGDFFCADSCGRIFRGLRGLVGQSRPMEGGFSWTLLRSSANDERKTELDVNKEMRAERDSKLSIALTVMQECFRPMIDPRTQTDIIAHVLYNRRSEMARLNFRGFYTMLLERGDELISVATVRMHGEDLAEMPLIGTRYQYRRQGMCRRLMSAIQELLQALGVKRLVLPAVPELLNTWTGAFGFKEMDDKEKAQLNGLNIMAFPGTSTLHKQLETMSNEALLNAMEEPTCADVGTSGLQKRHSDVPLVAPLVIVKRGPGRPPKAKGVTLGNGLVLPSPVAEAVTRKLAKAQSSVAAQLEPVKRGRGRPPKNKVALGCPNGVGSLPSTVAKGGARQRTVGRHGAENASSPRPKKATAKVAGPSPPAVNEGDHVKENQSIPQILRRKRGRPPRAKISDLIAESPSTVALSAQNDELENVQEGEGHWHVALAAKETDSYLDWVATPRVSEWISIGADEDGLDEMGTSRTPRTVTRSMQEEQASVAAQVVSSILGKPFRSRTPHESWCNGLLLDKVLRNELSVESSIGSTKTYERRKARLSPRSQRDESSTRVLPNECQSETLCGPLDLSTEVDQGLSGKPLPTYEEVSVPIRTFPSRFGMPERDKPNGTFIPVETTVVNNDPIDEPLDEVLVPDVNEDVDEPEMDAGRNESKLLLRLKLPKKKTPSPVCDMEIAQQRPSSLAMKFPSGGLVHPAAAAAAAALAVSDQMNGATRLEQFDQDQVKQPDSSIGPHRIPVTVS